MAMFNSEIPFFNGKPGKHHLNDSHWDVSVRSEVQDGVNGLWTEKKMTVEAVIEEDERPNDASPGWTLPCSKKPNCCLIVKTSVVLQTDS